MNRFMKFSGGIILMLSLCIINTACEKKEIQGPKGEPGTPGGGGNSSISNSDVFTIFSNQWKPNTDSTKWEVSVASELVTDEVVKKGSVKVYIHEETYWRELPNTTEDLFTQFSFEKGSIKLEHFDIHGALPDRPATMDYRVVTIYMNSKTSGDNLNNKVVHSSANNQ